MYHPKSSRFYQWSTLRKQSHLTRYSCSRFPGGNVTDEGLPLSHMVHKAIHSSSNSWEMEIVGRSTTTLYRMMMMMIVKEKKEKWPHFKAKISLYMGIKQLGNIGQPFMSVQSKLHGQGRHRNARPASTAGTAEEESLHILLSTLLCPSPNIVNLVFTQL